MKPSKDSEAVEAEAADWFARQQGERWAAADEAALQAWLESSTANRVAFVRLTAGWQRSARLVALGAGIPKGVIPARGSWTFSPFFDQSDAASHSASSGLEFRSVTPRPRASARRIGALAASVLIAVVGIVAAFYLSRENDAYRTAVGQTHAIPLSDGSRVILNTDSRIRVALSESERRIELNRGEAFFDVANDKTRPFTVIAGEKRIIAVGTKFSVRRTQDDVVVAVVEGKVRLEGERSDLAPATHLDAGAVAHTRKAAVRVRQHAVPEVEQLLSWRSGYVSFRDTNLADAVAEFNRYSKKKIRIQDAAIEHIRIGGNFRTDDAEPFLWLLENGFPVRVEHGTDDVVLTKR